MNIPAGQSPATGAFDEGTVNFAVPDGAGRGARLPWWLKVLAKLVLANAVPSYNWRRRLGFCIHSFAAATSGHPEEVRREIAWFQRLAGRPPASLLELGPGDSMANALYARAAGVERIWLMDVGDFATADMDKYRAIAASIERASPGFTATLDLASRAAMLDSIGATYITHGIAGLRDIPDGSVELSVSYMVLEHVRRAAFAPLLAELYRITAPGGLGHHFVDLMDHMGGGLNNLRFPSALWERNAIADSGVYTNRLGRAPILDCARRCGFETTVPHLQRWPVPPIARAALAAEFAGITDDELTVAGFDLRLRRP